MRLILKQKPTYVFWGIGILFLIAAIIVGIPDNAPGILLTYGASILFVLSFTWYWRKQMHFVMLILGSFIGFAVLAFAHGFFEAGGEGTIWGVIGAVFFLLAIFICPAGLLVGIIGSILTFRKSGLNE